VCVRARASACNLLGGKYIKGVGRNKPKTLLDEMGGEDYL